MCKRSAQPIPDSAGNPTPFKLCAGECKQIKPFEAFHRKRSNTSTGRHSVCRNCTRKRDKGRKRTGYQKLSGESSSVEQ